MKHNNQQDTVAQSAVAAIAAASQTPFKTAFKIYLGIGLAQVCLLAGLLLTTAIIVSLIA